ncbi:hypothetical protein JZ751_014827 [Albula glossodonta]|uniref:Uncharacterized protein n=1 Tax=Albula glossodonta TaxID=121402 RepID=A0A8T2N4H0_9TELE|nr:hypothetical protein JZ751_014827 [Albula glossodonta]
MASNRSLGCEAQPALRAPSGLLLCTVLLDGRFCESRGGKEEEEEEVKDLRDKTWKEPIH